VLRIRDVYPGSRIRLFSIPDPNCLYPGSRIRIEEFKYFNPKKMVSNSKLLKYDPGCSTRIPDPDADFLPIPDPGSRDQKGIGSRIRIRNTGNFICSYLLGFPGTYYIITEPVHTINSVYQCWGGSACF
jgi:hypothetical protein